MLNRLLLSILVLLSIPICALAQTTPNETWMYGKPTNCGSSCTTSTLTSGLRIPAVPSSTAGSLVTIPSNTFVIPSGSYNWVGGNTQPTCPLTDAATIAWSTTACASNAAKGTGFNSVTLGGNRTLGCGSGITAGNDGQVIVFYIQQPSSGGPYTLTPTLSCQWPTSTLNGNQYNLGTTPNEIDELIGHTFYYSGSTYLVVDNLIQNINPTIQLVAGATNSCGTTGTSPCTTTAKNFTGVNLIVAAVAYDPFGSVPTITDSSSNTGYTATITATGLNSKLKCFWKQAPTVSSSMTFSASAGTNVGIAVAGFSGVIPSPLDQSNSSTSGGSVTAQATGSITPSQPNELVVACLGLSGPPTPGSTSGIAINGGFSIASTINATKDGTEGAAIAYLAQTAAAAANPSFSWTTATDAAAGIISFK